MYKRQKSCIYPLNLTDKMQLFDMKFLIFLVPVSFISTDTPLQQKFRGTLKQMFEP